MSATNQHMILQAVACVNDKVTQGLPRDEAEGTETNAKKFVLVLDVSASMAHHKKEFMMAVSVMQAMTNTAGVELKLQNPSGPTHLVRGVHEMVQNGVITADHHVVILTDGKDNDPTLTFTYDEDKEERMLNFQGVGTPISMLSNCERSEVNVEYFKRAGCCLHLVGIGNYVHDLYNAARKCGRVSATHIKKDEGAENVAKLMVGLKGSISRDGAPRDGEGWKVATSDCDDVRNVDLLAEGFDLPAVQAQAGVLEWKDHATADSGMNKHEIGLEKHEKMRKKNTELRKKNAAAIATSEKKYEDICESVDKETKEKIDGIISKAEEKKAEAKRKRDVEVNQLDDENAETLGDDLKTKKADVKMMRRMKKSEIQIADFLASCDPEIASFQMAARDTARNFRAATSGAADVEM